MEVNRTWDPRWGTTLKLEGERRAEENETLPPFRVTEPMQVSLPTSLVALQWYSPTSAVSTFRMWMLVSKFSDIILYFFPLRSSRLSFCQETWKGGVPWSSHSRWTSAPLSVSTGKGFLRNTGGSRIEGGEKSPLGWTSYLDRGRN